MKTRTALALAPLALLLAAGAHAAPCVYPQAPQALPNGKTATEAEMKTANAAVKEYSTSVQDEYLKCLEQERDEAIAALDNMDPQYTQKKTALESIQAKKHNAALDELQALAVRWNTELRAFKEKNSK
jgi:hypothetical protein